METVDSQPVASKFSRVRLWRLAQSSWGLKTSSDYGVQLVRSIVVSVVALIVDFSVLVFLKQALGINYLLSATISFSLGVLVNYFLSVAWVFADHKLASRKHEFIIFVVITGIGLGLNLAIIAGVVELLRLDYKVGKAVATVVVFFWNFIIRKKFLY